MRWPSRLRGRPVALAAAATLVAAILAALGYWLVYGRPDSGGPHFVEQTAAAGIDHVYAGDAAYDVGGGVAVLDCDNDGHADLYLPGGSNPAALFRNRSTTGGPLAFTRLASPVTDLTGVLGAYPIDINGDSNVDLVVLRLGETEILRGLGGCRFKNTNADWSFDGADGYTTAFSAKWESYQALPVLAFGHYRKLDPSGRPTLDCADNQFYRQKPDGSGYDGPIALSPGYCTLSMLFSDWDRSGRPDLRVTNDKNYYADGSDQLWRMASGEAPRQYTDADGWVSLQIFGMGIAGYDVSGDGYPDYYLTSQGDNRLQTLTAGPGQPTFRDIAGKRGVTSAQPFTGGDVLPSTSWHPEFQDVNNDGLIDLFVSKGNVAEQPGFATKDPSDLFLGRPDGTFEEAADKAGILNFDRGRGAALADFNVDGLPDLVEVNYGAPVRLWLNTGSSGSSTPRQLGHWLALRPFGYYHNPDGIGGWIEVKTGDSIQRREITIGGGHAGGQLGWIHFGLGSATEAQVRVIWPQGQLSPTGAAGQWMTIAADQFAYLDQGQSYRTWVPAR